MILTTTEKIPNREIDEIHGIASGSTVRARSMKLKILVGSGRKIGLLTLPFLIAGLTLNLIFPDFFSAGGPSPSLIWVSIIMLIPGIIVWIWSVYLILTKIPRKKLITNGPYSIVKHPLYTGVALLVIPWGGILCDTWLGIFIGVIVYIGSRIYSPPISLIPSRQLKKERQKKILYRRNFWASGFDE